MMITPKYVRTMARYNAWMNHRLYDLCGQLSEEELRVDRGAYFQSIFGTLEHLVRGDLAWKLRFEGRHQEVAAIAGLEWPRLADLRRQREALDAYFLQWAAAVRQEELDGEMSYTSMLNQTSYTRPRALLIIHLFNHQTHHRGQITTLLTQRGLDIGVTDLPLLPEG